MNLVLKAKTPIMMGIMLLLSLSLAAKFVNSNQALDVAQNWLQYWQPQRSQILDEIHTYTATELELYQPSADTGGAQEPELYLVYFDDGAFVVVPGDDNLNPILAYSSHPVEDKSLMPPSFKMLLDFYAADVRYARRAGIKKSENSEMWEKLQAGDYSFIQRDREVSPLLATTWNQDYPYNALCPEDADGPGGHVYAGCVATAMGQVMKYWNSPVTGQGSNTYYAYGYGYQTVNFGETTYLWDEMPNAVGSEYLAVATLLYHCAVGVDMSFSPDGSGSNGMRARDAMQDYFGYPGATYVQKADYSTTAWESLIKEQLDNGVPMYYSGSGDESGHAWNCDGYQGSNYFHFNLGWGGSYNGYYYMNSIEPGGSHLNYYQAAIINAIPTNYTITQPRIQMQAQNSMAGDPFELYLSTYPVLSEWDVDEFSLSIYYDHINLQYLGADLEGTIADGGNLVIDTSSPGYLNISWSRDTPLFGGGNLLNIEFQSIEPGEYLFIPVDMSYNGQILSNVEVLVVPIDAAVENLVESQITMSNVMHVAYNTYAAIPVNTSYLLPSWGVNHYEFDLGYDPAKLQFHDLQIEETLSAGATVNTEIVSPGTVHIEVDTDAVLTGQNPLLVRPRFLAIGNGSTNLPTIVSMSNFYYNDTAIASTPNSVVVLSATSSVEDDAPQAHMEVQNYPNPFNPSTTIKLSLPVAGHVKAVIYNLKGQKIYSLQDGMLGTGEHSFVWHGVDQDSRAQANGIYLLKVETAEGNMIRKLTLMK